MSEELTIQIAAAVSPRTGRAGAGAVLRCGERQVGEVSRCLGKVASREEAEYRALLEALAEAGRQGARRLQVDSASRLLVRQMSGQARAREPRLRSLHAEAVRRCGGLELRFRHRPRRRLGRALELARRAAGEAEQVSAGGVVYRRGPAGIEVCLVAKHGVAVWALPKGRVAPGERLEETALREVLEETGHQAEVEGELGRLEYRFYWKPTRTHYRKRVHFFLMPLVRAGARPRDGEADRVAWFSLEEARARLTYDNEREILERARQRLGGRR